MSYFKNSLDFYKYLGYNNTENNLKEVGMSQNLRLYRDEQNNEMYVTAFIGSDDGNYVQLTIGDKYIELSPNQIQDLIWVLQGRVKGRLTATGDEINFMVCDKNGDLKPVDDDNETNNNHIRLVYNDNSFLCDCDIYELLKELVANKPAEAFDICYCENYEFNNTDDYYKYEWAIFVGKGENKQTLCIENNVLSCSVDVIIDYENETAKIEPLFNEGAELEIVRMIEDILLDKGFDVEVA